MSGARAATTAWEQEGDEYDDDFDDSAYDSVHLGADGIADAEGRDLKWPTISLNFLVMHA